MASAYIQQGRFPRSYEGARERFERAIALNPRSAEAHHQFGFHLWIMGDTAAAMRENLRALELEPGRAITWFAMSEMARLKGRPHEALQYTDSMLAADPDFALAYLQRYATGLSLRDTALIGANIRALASRPGFREAAAFMQAAESALVSGDPAIIRSLSDAMLAAPPLPSPTSPGNVLPGSFVAMIFAMLGDKETALLFLDRLTPRGFRLHDSLRAPGFDNLRSDPRFIRLWNETRAPGSVW